MVAMRRLSLEYEQESVNRDYSVGENCVADQKELIATLVQTGCDTAAASEIGVIDVMHIIQVLICTRLNYIRIRFCDSRNFG